MINYKPKTYRELIIMKGCYELTKYFELSNEMLDEFYSFLIEDDKRKIVTTMIIISLMVEDSTEKTISAIPKSDSFVNIVVDNKGLHVIKKMGEIQ